MMVGPSPVHNAARRPRRSGAYLQLLRLPCLLTYVVVAAAPMTAQAAKAPLPGTNPTVSATCPWLSSGPFRGARLAHLSDGVVLKSSSTSLTRQEIAAEIEKAPAQIRQQLRNNAFFVLEQLASRRLLLSEAREWAATSKSKSKGDADDSLIRAYLLSLTQRVSVDDAELKRFYEQNKSLVGGAPLEQIQKDLSEYLLSQKRQQVVDKHIATLSERTAVQVDETWTKQQCRLASDNPVDTARRSGKPTLVDFGATGCGPCDMMTPILASLKKKYAGRLNVLFVHVQEEQILAARYGVRTIPVQVFFDKGGKEVFRHEGFFPQAEIERKLSEMGLKR